MSKGIDVSVHNGVIDWQKVKAGGVEFAIIRAGFGRTADKRFSANITGARSAGVVAGVYWFIYALDEAGAEAEADYCYNLIKGYKIDLPVYCDFEYDTERYAKEQGVTYTKASRTAIIRAFCERIKKRGYKTGVYLNPDYIKNKLNYNDIKCYPLWLALWVNNGVTSHAAVADTRVSTTYGQPAIWQFGKGVINGISGYTDVNYGYENLPEIAPVETVNPQTAAPVFQKGDKVKVKNTFLVGRNKCGKTYAGGNFVIYYTAYDVIQASGNRVVIGIGKTITAAVNSDSLEQA